MVLLMSTRAVLFFRVHGIALAGFQQELDPGGLHPDLVVDQVHVHRGVLRSGGDVHRPGGHAVLETLFQGTGDVQADVQRLGRRPGKVQVDVQAALTGRDGVPVAPELDRRGEVAGVLGLPAGGCGEEDRQKYEVSFHGIRK